MILDVDPERRRISLGLKQCIDNPWASFAQKYKKGDSVSGVIKSITDFGVFIGIDGNIDGLIHLSDLSWTLSGEEAVKQYKKGDQVSAMVLAIDVERERVSLGIKQLENDPFSGFLTENEKGTLLKGTISDVDEKGATVDLINGMQAYIKANDLSNERISDARKVVKVGDEIEAAFVTVDRKNNQILLSVRALQESDARETKERLQNQEEQPSTTLGDLIKEQLANRDEK
jgi:small subunit ribosomal protein S1